MASTFKTMHFHQLFAYKRDFKKVPGKSDKLIKNYLDQEELDNLFKEIIEEKTINNCIRIQKENDPDFNTLEILKYEDNYIFGKIGKEKDVRAFNIREEGTYKAKPIPLEKNQIFEVFTYLLIDRKNFIVSYLYEMSAPTIFKLGELITNQYKHENIFGEIASVSIDDAIPYLSKKDIIGTITYKTTLPPSDSRLWNEELTGLNRETYESLVNLKNVEFTIKLVAERNKDVFPDKGKLRQTLNKLSKFATKTTVRAKNEDEYMQEHSLNNNPLTKKVKFDFNQELQNVKEVQENIYSNMVKVYSKNKQDILDHCKV